MRRSGSFRPDERDALQKYLRDQDHGGGNAQPPWLYIRAKLAEAWYCRPGDIDEVDDADEIGVTLQIWSAEAESRRYAEAMKRRREDTD